MTFFPATPQMNGRDLAERLLPDKPGMKCLFMSGYSVNVIARHGVLNEGVHFIRKPFTMKGLGAKVREVLGAGPRKSEHWARDGKPSYRKKTADGTATFLITRRP